VDDYCKVNTQKRGRIRQMRSRLVGETYVGCSGCPSRCYSDWRCIDRRHQRTGNVQRSRCRNSNWSPSCSLCLSASLDTRYDHR